MESKDTYTPLMKFWDSMGFDLEYREYFNVSTMEAITDAMEYFKSKNTNYTKELGKQIKKEVSKINFCNGLPVKIQVDDIGFYKFDYKSDSVRYSLDISAKLLFETRTHRYNMEDYAMMIEECVARHLDSSESVVVNKFGAKVNSVHLMFFI